MKGPESSKNENSADTVRYWCPKCCKIIELRVEAALKCNECGTSLQKL